MSLAEYKITIDGSPQYYSSSGGTSNLGFLGARSSGTDGRYAIVPQAPDKFSDYEHYDFPDWDSYGADPITSETVKAARRLNHLLPRNAANPDIAPAGDGTIGFEWRSGTGPDRTIVFVEVGPGQTIRASRFYAGNVVETWPSKPLEVGVYGFINALFPSNESA